MSFAIPSPECHMPVMCSCLCSRRWRRIRRPNSAPRGAGRSAAADRRPVFERSARSNPHSRADLPRLHQDPEGPAARDRGALADRPVPQARICCHQRALQRAAAGHGHRGGPPDCVLPEYRALATEEVPGRPFGELLANRSNRRRGSKPSPGASARGYARTRPLWKREARSSSASAGPISTTA